MGRNGDFEQLLIMMHEAKAPLAVMRQLAFSFDVESAKNNRVRTDMIRVADRALKQIDDLMKIARLEDGLFEMEPVSVRAVCDIAYRDATQLFYTSQKDVRIDYCGKLSLVTANFELLYSVLLNFLSNAAKYANNGTVARLIVRDIKDGVRFTVRDNGPLLPIAIWRKLQTQSLDTPVNIAMRPGSSGFGLFIAARFSQYMNAKIGSIRHRNGMSFYVELPVSRQASLFE